MMDCAPGKSSTPTKKGRFTVGSKGYYFDSGSARCFYFTQFSGNYLFHSVLYSQTSSPKYVTDGTMGRPASTAACACSSPMPNGSTTTSLAAAKSTSGKQTPLLKQKWAAYEAAHFCTCFSGGYRFWER